MADFFFSVVVPTYNRPDHLARLLEALAGQRFPRPDFEVVVVDDGGRADLEPTLNAFRNRLNLNLLRQANAGPGAARNFGAARAGGAWLAFTDDDCLPDQGWLENLALVFRRTPVCLCGGRTLSAWPDEPFARTTQALLDYLHPEPDSGKNPGAFFASNNLAVPRDIFLEMGGFDPTLRLGEDREFCHRWALSGRPFASAPEALVRHAHALGLGSFLRLHFAYGGGSFRFKRRSAQKSLPPPRFRSLRFYLDLVLVGLRRERSPRGALVSLLLLASQAANAAGYFWAALRDRAGRRAG